MPLVIGINKDISYIKDLEVPADNELVVVDLDNNDFLMNAKIMLEIKE